MNQRLPTGGPYGPLAARLLPAALLVLAAAALASGEPTADAPPKDAAPTVAPAKPGAAAKAPVPAGAPAPADTVMRLGLVVRPSVFVDNYASGVDPFHPKSRRRHPKSDVIVALPDASDSALSGRIEQLSLKGITGQGAARLALINNRSFSAGESGSVRIPGGQMQIRVLELGERAVKIQIEGDPKTHEIKLDDRTYDFTQTR